MPVIFILRANSGVWMGMDRKGALIGLQVKQGMLTRRAFGLMGGVIFGDILLLHLNFHLVEA